MVSAQRKTIKTKPFRVSGSQLEKMDAGTIKDNEIIFSVLKQIADAFASTFPRTSEVVVHDLSQPQQSIKHIAGDITHRKIGGPITDLVIKALHREGRDIRDRHNYKTTNSDGRVLKSTTVFVRNSCGGVVAALCINFDITDFLNAAFALEIFTSTESGINGSEKAETFAKSISETIEALLQQAIVKIGKQPSSMAIEEKIELVKELENSGSSRSRVVSTKQHYSWGFPNIQFTTI